MPRFLFWAATQEVPEADPNDNANLNNLFK